MNGGIPGFRNAPASRAVVVAAALFSVTFGFRGRLRDLGLSYQASSPSRLPRVFHSEINSVYEKLQIWRLIISLFAFSSTPELIFGAALLYYFRVFERQIGSNKYAVFIIFSTVVSVLLQILALGYLKGSLLFVYCIQFFSDIRSTDPSLDMLTSGPYGLIFASYVPFFFDIPISMKFRIFGLSVSDKSFVYLAGLQLLFSSGRHSIIPGLSGILAGLLYRMNTFGIRRLKGTHSATQDLTESSIATLVSMGFDRTSAMRALALTNYDVNLASNILLEAQALQS
ncbi:hypothetical protein EJB05_16582 [Eragrostis curvula]|uniref:UBA domain-containing protein n=1 Tax=Eragrostis curvula TaxID=38414 RepID=A0A5J9VFA4_9POAL|nr:hypothetical protein EJB05_16582 [Eragrostis curvula]